MRAHVDDPARLTGYRHVTGFTLPAPFDRCSLGAHTEHGRRTLSWSLHEPGTLHRNRFTMAWFDITERTPWAGEPLWFSASRRIPGAEHTRQSFTDSARLALAASVLPAVARYGFSRLWEEAHGRRVRPDSSRAVAAHMDEVAAWWRGRADLEEMHAAGLVEFVPVRDDPGQRGPVVTMYAQHAHGDGLPERVAAWAVVGGETVGALTTHAALVPIL